MLLKWSPQQRADTIPLHAAIADGHGSVWWGKFGRGVAASRIEHFRKQLEGGAATHVYLVGGGELWRTQLVAITGDQDEIDETLKPDYYASKDCGLFVQLTNFERLD